MLGKEGPAVSRSTDMYAFAILCWELLSQETSFADIHTGPDLKSALDSGYRPSLDFLPSDTSYALKEMIKHCWDKDRKQRYPAVKCYSILSAIYQQMAEKRFNIFFSHKWNQKDFLVHIHSGLLKQGYRVWYDQHHMEHKMDKSMTSGVAGSDVFLACVSKLYQQSDNCIFELSEAYKSNKPIIVLVLDEKPHSWMTETMKDMCNLKSNLFIDISGFYRQFQSKIADEDDVKDIDINHLDEIMKHLHPLLSQYTEPSIPVKTQSEMKPKPVNYGISVVHLLFALIVAYTFPYLLSFLGVNLISSVSPISSFNTFQLWQILLFLYLVKVYFLFSAWPRRITNGIRWMLLAIHLLMGVGYLLVTYYTVSLIFVNLLLT